MGFRPCESRNDLLNRWVRMKREERFEKYWEKPTDPGTVLTLAECERWRKRVLETMDEKLTRLYTEPIPPAETRFLNDEVNKMIKEVRRWEMRIVELGGIDYSRVGVKMPDGDILNTNNNQYQYFGRARNLPGVKELLEEERKQLIEKATGAQKINKEQLMEKVNSDYYGLMDDEKITEQEIKFAMDNNYDNFSWEPDLTPAKIPQPHEIQIGLNELYSGKTASVIV
ncbi:Cell cycle control protein [Histomonas meleagridis]|uniref:Cell cycle control protein n=1 Tax=Histomonas meleagridis TaxID=135588 RepID=UPI00355978ED|nr:Cell cycle control protein [Histomonas meleagridis]KAH0801147.1 Cell cycle control protein [Histomonas meleagridis]